MADKSTSRRKQENTTPQGAGPVLNVAYYTHYRGWLKNRMFDLNFEAQDEDVLDRLSRWVALKEFLAERNVNFSTYDTYNSFEEVDIWLMQEPMPDKFKFILRNRINLRKVIFILTEPPVVNSWGWKYLKYYSWLFKVILTWNSELCRQKKKYIHYHFPQRFDESKYPYYKSKNKKNLCLMLHANKTSNAPGELYSLRREIIRYFERRSDALLDVYGYGWNDEKRRTPFFTNLYKGTTPDKKETYSEYYFTFCIDNCVVPGYITYDPLIAMSTGTVPIYLPMPDSLQYIPENTFVNYNHFQTLDELVSYIKSIAATDRYEEYRRNGWEFLNSEKYYPFTTEKYCDDVYRAIQVVTNRSVWW